MSSTAVPDPDVVQPVHLHHQDDAAKKVSAEVERAHIEEKIDARKSSVEDIEDARKGHALGRVDKELAKYAGDTRIDITPEDITRLRKLIDKRVLLVMVVTYFLQAIDKGTLSFASIMGLPQDNGLVDANGKVTQQFSWLTSCIYITILVVEYPQVSRQPI